MAHEVSRKSTQFSLISLFLVLTALPIVAFISNVVFAVSYRAVTPNEEMARSYFAPFNCIVFFLHFASLSIPGLKLRVFPWRIILTYLSMLAWCVLAYFFSLPSTKYFPSFPRADVLRQNVAFRVLGWLPVYLTIYFVLGFALILGVPCKAMLDLMVLPIGWPAVAKTRDLAYGYWHLALFVINALIWCIAAECVTWRMGQKRRGDSV